MRIGLKMTAAFLLVASLVAAAGYLAQRTGRELNDQMERLSHSALRQMAAVSEVTTALYADQLAAHQQLRVRRRDETPPEAAPVQPDGSGGALASSSGQSSVPPRARAALVDLMRSASHPAMKPLQREFDAHQNLMERFTALVDRDLDAAERFLENSVGRHFRDELLPRLAAARRQAEGESTRAIRSAQRALAVADQRRGMLLAAAAALAVSIGLFMSRSIGKPLGELQQAAQEIGRGRLDTRATVRSRDEIGALADALNQMAAQLREKTVSKGFVDNIIHSMREMLIVTAPDLRIRLVNPAVCSELGYDDVELIDRPLDDLFAEDADVADLAAPAGATGLEGLMCCRSGQRIPVRFSTARMHDEAGRLEGVVCVALNMSRQKEAELLLRASLREKELLLQEVHHRVKNNLQIISSLLSLQAQQIRDPRMVRLFEESQARVRSMALIHEQLYRSRDLAHVDFAAYIRELVDHLRQGFGSAAVRVEFQLDVQPLPLLLDVAIPCGMIINELVANALEHAFPDGRPGRIRIAFGRHASGYRIVVEDDGVGMRREPLDAEPASIGLKVVDALVRQIHGRLDQTYEEGTRFTICFQNPEPPTLGAEPA